MSTASTLALLLLASFALPASTQSNARLEVIGTPRALDRIVLRLSQIDSCPGQVERVKFSDGEFVISMKPALCSNQPPSETSEEIQLGRLPEGSYSARIENRSPHAQPFGVAFAVGPAPVTNAEADSRGLADHSGVWSVRNRNGESVFVQHDTGTDQMVIVWNTHTNGDREWVGAAVHREEYGKFTGYVFVASRQGITFLGPAEFYGHATNGEPTDPTPLTLDDAFMTLDLGNGAVSMELSRFRMPLPPTR